MVPPEHLQLKIDQAARLWLSSLADPHLSRSLVSLPVRSPSPEMPPSPQVDLLPDVQFSDLEISTSLVVLAPDHLALLAPE